MEWTSLWWFEIFETSFVYNADELYISYELSENSTITRVVLNELGLLQHLVSE